MRIAITLGIIGLAASGARAADKVVIAPVANWVVPVALPPLPAPSQAALSILLRDEQFDLEPGHQSRYLESAFRINKPEGLSAGLIALPWNPEIETLTVHKLVIRRGDKVIDVLAAGQAFTVVRRETNLENASIDGELTATIQPEGLQVGDIVDFAVTVSRADPAMGQHAEMIGAGWNGFPIARAHLRAQWPAALPMQIRSSELPALKPVRRGNMSSVELSMDSLDPVKSPNLAPARFGYGRLVEFSDFSSWTGLADLMAPLYAKAATLPAQGALQTEIQRIKALSPDPKVRAEAALALVQDRVRYVFLGINDGGLIPADAETTWSRRFGDCKGKTVLLLALLHAMNIEAAPVIVSTALGDGMDQRLPLVEVFDHVMIRTTIGGKAYWLDGTRLGDGHLDAITVPAFHWGLPLVAGTRGLVPMVPSALKEPATDITLKLDARSGVTVPALAHAERVLRGDSAVYTNQQIANLSGSAREQGLRDFWRGKYDFITPGAVDAVFDADKRELKLTMDGSAKMEWNDGYYQTDDTSVGYKADFTREAGPGHDAPFAVDFPSYIRVRETIQLPPGAFTIYQPEDIDQTVGGIAYRRHADIKDGMFTVEETERTQVSEFPAAEAVAAQDQLRALYKKQLYIKLPVKYAMTDAELVVPPTTANGYINRGNTFLNRTKFDLAIADFDKAIALDPHNVTALADRGLSYVWKGDDVAAKRDLDAADAIAPRNAVVFRARALIAAKANDNKAVIAALGTALEIEPENAWALSLRAASYHNIGENDLAAADARAAVKLLPTNVDLYLLLANIARSRADRVGSLAQADAAVAANPNNAYAYVVAARIQSTYGNREAAFRLFDRAIAIKPEAYIYVNRSEARPDTDRAGRLADLDAALKLDPASIEAMVFKAKVQSDLGDLTGAAATLTDAHAHAITDGILLVRRGIVYTKLGKADSAAADFVAARALAKSASALNGLCWEKATANIALDAALADCDAALIKDPMAAPILDSRAFVLLRLGRYEDSIAAYDKALAARSGSATSLYGRAIAEALKGDLIKARADGAAATALDPDVAKLFKTYGITAPAGVESAAAAH